MNKLYFNVTKIMNGWVVDYSPSFEADAMTPMSQEKFLKTLPEVYEFISIHTEEVKKVNSMTLRHLFEDSEKDEKTRALRLEYLIELRKEGLI